MIFPKSIALALVFLPCIAFKPLHHGWASYDQEKVLDYTGIIQESVYENPHVVATVKQNNKTWTVVLAPVSRMNARGLTAAMLKKGTTLKVVGYPHKEVRDEMRAERIFIEGKNYELR